MRATDDEYPSIAERRQNDESSESGGRIRSVPVRKVVEIMGEMPLLDALAICLPSASIFLSLSSSLAINNPISDRLQRK